MASCKKEIVATVVTTPQSTKLPWPAPSPSNEIINTNLKWDINYTTKVATARLAELLPAPSPYSVDSIRGVYTFANNVYKKIDGTIDLNGSNIYYYIHNNIIDLYKNNIQFAYDLPVDLLFIPSTGKITFR